MSDGTLVCTWCGGQTRVLGQRPTPVQVRDSDIAVYAEDGVLFVAVDFPNDTGAEGRQTRHYCTRIPAEYRTRT
jgi:hypothetical protein